MLMRFKKCVGHPAIKYDSLHVGMIQAAHMYLLIMDNLHVQTLLDMAKNRQALDCKQTLQEG